jgi:hypothetical protein
MNGDSVGLTNGGRVAPLAIAPDMGLGLALQPSLVRRLVDRADEEGRKVVILHGNGLHVFPNLVGAGREISFSPVELTPLDNRCSATQISYFQFYNHALVESTKSCWIAA